MAGVLTGAYGAGVPWDAKCAGPMAIPLPIGGAHWQPLSVQQPWGWVGAVLVGASAPSFTAGVEGTVSAWWPQSLADWRAPDSPTP